jgi:hypothetical protein
MTNRFLISVAALALIAGTGFANAQGSRESGGGAQMQSAPSSGGGGAAGGAAAEHENGKAASPSSGMRSEKSPAAGQGQRAEENMPGQKSKSMSSQNETKGAPDNMKAEGRETGANKAAETRQPGRETEKNAQNREGRETEKNAQNREGRESEKNAQMKGRENEKNAETQGNRENMQAQGREGRENNKNAQGRTESSTTVGQAGAGAKLSTEQRTKITTIIRDEHVAPVNNVDFSLNVGTRVPRERISLRPLPSEVVTVYPEWRGYEFFLVGDKIVVVDPRSLEIVDILEA